MDNTNKELSTKLTDEQIEEIGKVMEECKNAEEQCGNVLNFPDNTEEADSKKMMVAIDPQTGEHKIMGEASDIADEESFDEMCDRIANSEINVEEAPITEDEIKEELKSNSNVSILSELTTNPEDLSADNIKQILNIVNRKMKREKFNIYKELPEEIQEMINTYVKAGTGDLPLVSNQYNMMRNALAESIIDEFISNISMNRIQHDFNKEVEELFNKSAAEMADATIGYTLERNAKYREAAEKMEDEDKKKKVLEILDHIDEAHNLTHLKEFAKKCKVKSIELEKPWKVYSSFLMKYKYSQYNIYDINMAIPILARNITDEDHEYTDKDIYAFFIVFCKQCLNKSPDVVTDHAYMYYVLYNIVLLDMNKGESKNISDEFKDNVREVISNIKVRNNL